MCVLCVVREAGKTTSFRISLSSTKISDMIATNVSLSQVIKFKLLLLLLETLSNANGEEKRQLKSELAFF